MKFPFFFLIGFALSSLSVTAQTLSDRPSWAELAANSTIVVVGKVQDTAQVIRPDKLHLPHRTLPDGSVTTDTPNPEEYVLGRVVRFQIERVLNKDREPQITQGSVLNIYISGWRPRDGDPAFESGISHLVFLTPTRLKAGETAFVGARIERTVGSVAAEPFDPRSCFLVVENDKGVVPLTQDNRQVLSEVEAVLRRRKRAVVRPRRDHAA